MELLLDAAFMPLPGTADRSELTSSYSLQLATVICPYASVAYRHTFLLHVAHPSSAASLSDVAFPCD